MGQGVLGNLVSWVSPWGFSVMLKTSLICAL